MIVHLSMFVSWSQPNHIDPQFSTADDLDTLADSVVSRLAVHHLDQLTARPPVHLGL